MKLRVDRNTLAEAVSWVVSCVFPAPHGEHDHAVVLNARGDGSLLVSAQLHGTAAQRTLDAEVIDGHRFEVNGQLLHQLCTSMPGEDVDMSVDGNWLLLASDAAVFSLPLHPASPDSDVAPLPHALGMVKAHDVTLAVHQVADLPSPHPAVAALCGVNITTDSEFIGFAAADKYRIATSSSPWRSTELSPHTELTVPADVLRRVTPLFPDDSVVAVGMADDSPHTTVGFATPGRVVTFETLAVQFPPVRRYFPRTVSSFAVLRRSELIDALRLATIIAQDSVAVRLTFVGAEVFVEVGDKHAAQGQQRLSAHLVGEPLSIAFNPEFLLAGVVAVDQDFVRLSFTDPHNPAVLTGQNDLHGADEQLFRYLIMSIRLDTE